MVDKDGNTNGTWSQSGAALTLRFPGNITYNGVVQGKNLAGTASNGKTTWTFNATNPAALAGSDWSGTETLASYGTLSFRFRNEGRAIMVDRDGDTPGFWKRDGDTITMEFGKTVTYTGTLKDSALSGNATNGAKNWTFAVSSSKRAHHWLRAARRWDALSSRRATSTGPSRSSTRRSRRSRREALIYDTGGRTPTTRSASTRRRSRTARPPSSSTRKSATRTTCAAWSCRSRASWTRRSRTTTRPCRSRRRTRTCSPTAAWPTLPRRTSRRRSRTTTPRSS